MARTGTNEGVANIRQPKLQEVRALAMVESRIHGRTLAQIADEFNVSVDTVKRSLSKAEKLDLTARYEDYLVGRLAPLAIGAVEHALMENDVAAAMKILESVGLIKKPKDQGRKDEEDGDTWEAYLKVRKTSSPLPAVSVEDVDAPVEARVVEERAVVAGEILPSRGDGDAADN